MGPTYSERLELLLSEYANGFCPNVSQNFQRYHSKKVNPQFWNFLVRDDHKLQILKYATYPETLYD